MRSLTRSGPMGRWAVALTGLAAVLALGACGGTASGSPTAAPAADPDLNTPAVALTGAGSTFDQPFFSRAFYQYNVLNSRVTVNYASIGSGGGIGQLQAQTVNFGATDVPMTEAEQSAAKGGAVLQIPVTLGGTAISYNLYGVQGGLHLTGQVLAQVYLGKITRWNDPALTSLNPRVNLPDQAITVVHRSDASGTSYIFTDYLANVSPDWKNGPGTGKSINWPVGVGGKGNEGVAGSIKQIPGSIGYVELAYALQNNFTSAAMQNRDGSKFLEPSLATVAADAAQKPDVSPTDFSIVNEPGPDSYPISGYSWVVVYEQQPKSDAGVALAKMLDWLTHSGGQDQAKAIQYVPLPSNIQQLARSTIDRMTDGTTGKPFLKG